MMISIVIIVKKDKKVEETINEVLKNEIDMPKEVIIVDKSEGQLNYIRDKFVNRVNWIEFPENPNKKWTIPEQRNTGIKAAKGEIIVFIDASCIPDKNWLKNLLYPIRYDNENFVAGATFSTGTTTTNDLFHLKNKENKYLEECATINLAFKKELCEKVGYFDETFDYGSDVDFAWRVVDSGYKIRYAPNALITHDWGDYKEEIKRNLLYGQARAHLYLKHKHRLKNIFSKDPVLAVYPMFILLLPITFLIPWYPLILVLLVIKNLKDPKPVSIVMKHLVYGFGALQEVCKNIVKSK